MGEPTDDQSPEQRERELQRREAAVAARAAAAQEVLDAAELRDSDADERDERAIKRDRDEDRKAFLDPNAEHYGTDGTGRRHAAMDRGDAKQDRHHSADDREKLTDELGADGDESTES